MKVRVDIDYEEDLDGASRVSVGWEAEPAMPLSLALLIGVLERAKQYVARQYGPAQEEVE